jgi:hypothetical protein
MTNRDHPSVLQPLGAALQDTAIQHFAPEGPALLTDHQLGGFSGGHWMESSDLAHLAGPGRPNLLVSPGRLAL